MEKNTLGKVLIFGGTGMVGSQCEWPNTVKYNSKQCDITRYAAVTSALRKEWPDIVVLLAAKSDLIWCEANPYEAIKINVFGAANVALACRMRNIKLVFMSSMAVFPNDVTHGLLNDKVLAWRPEEIVEKPSNIYGETKLIGEQIVASFSPGALIIRPGRMFGGGYEYDRKFIRICYEALASGKDYIGYTNHYCSLIYIPDLWEAIEKFLQDDASGIIHIANSGSPVSLYDICLFIKEKGQLPGALHKGVAEQEANGYIATANQSIYSSVKLRSWQDAMKEYLEILKTTPL